MPLPGGGIMCGTFPAPKPCSVPGCAKPGEFLCDWKVGKHANGRRKRCSRAVCADHALEVGNDKHLCLDHQDKYRDWLDAHPRLPL